MTDEVSEHMRLSVLVWMIGALLSAVVGVLIMSLHVLDNYTDKYVEAVVDTTTASINSLNGKDLVSGAIVYSAVIESSGDVDAVYVTLTDQPRQLIFKFNDGSETDLMKLMTLWKSRTFKVTVRQGDFIKTLHTVELVEVVR